MNTPKVKHKRFKNLALGIQSLTLTIAILVGGGWTLYTYIATDVQKLAKKSLFQQAQIDIDLQGRHYQIENNKHCISATVAITNNGDRNVFLDYSDAPFSVTLVAFNADGKSEFKKILTQSNLISKSRVLREGETVDYPFFVVVDKTGMYVLQFRVPLPPDEMPEHRGVGGPEGKIFWAGSTYLYVSNKDNSQNVTF